MKKRTLIFFVCYCAYVSIYIARLNLSMASPSLKTLEVLTTAQIGLLGSMFSVVYACGRLFSGWLSDRTQPWIMVCTGLSLCGISNLICGSLPVFPAFLLLWGVNALSQSMLWGAILRILSFIYEPEVAKRKGSYMGSAVAAGNLAGILLTSVVIEQFGVAWAFLLPGTITLVLAFAVFFCTKSVTSPITIKPSQRSNALANKNLHNMLLPAFIHGVMKDNISLWMAVYVLDRFGLQLEDSAAYMLLIPALGFVGRIAAPQLYRLCHSNEYRLIAVSFLVCMATALILTFMPLQAWSAVVCLSLIYMAVSVINACTLAIFPMRFAETGQVASVSGIMDFATYLGTGLSAMVYGVVIDQYGYGIMFASWAILSLLSSILLKISTSKSKTNAN